MHHIIRKQSNLQLENISGEGECGKPVEKKYRNKQYIFVEILINARKQTVAREIMITVRYIEFGI